MGYGDYYSFFEGEYVDRDFRRGVLPEYEKVFKKYLELEDNPFERALYIAVNRS